MNDNGTRSSPIATNKTQPVGWVSLIGTIVVGVLIGMSVEAYRTDASVKAFGFDGIVKLAELVILAGGLISLILLKKGLDVQVSDSKATREDVAREFHWNRVETFYKYFAAPDKQLQLQMEFDDLVKEFKLDGYYEDDGKSITDDSIIRELSSKMGKHGAIMVAYLDRLESLSAAVISGFVEPDFAYCLLGGRIVRAVVVFEKVIKEIQKNNRKSVHRAVEVAFFLECASKGRSGNARKCASSVF